MLPANVLPAINPPRHWFRRCISTSGNAPSRASVAVRISIYLNIHIKTKLPSEISYNNTDLISK